MTKVIDLEAQSDAMPGDSSASEDRCSPAEAQGAPPGEATRHEAHSDSPVAVVPSYAQSPPARTTSQVSAETTAAIDIETTSYPESARWRDSVEHYYDGVSGVYDHLYSDKLSLQENEYIAKRLRNVGNRVLDLGCGTGLGLTLLPRDDIGYLGIDISPGMIEQAERLTGLGKLFQVGNMEHLDVADGVVTDVISLFSSFSHCEHPQAVIDEIYRVLAPGGRVLLMALSRYSLSRLLRLQLRATGGYRIRRSAETGIVVPARFYTPRELRALAERRFTRVSVTGLTVLGQVYPWAGISRLDLNLARIWPSIAHSLVLEGVKPNA